jgi:ligand-binding SRPBCC domain-containing protein
VPLLGAALTAESRLTCEEVPMGLHWIASRRLPWDVSYEEEAFATAAAETDGLEAASVAHVVSRHYHVDTVSADGSLRTETVRRELGGVEVTEDMGTEMPDPDTMRFRQAFAFRRL